MLLGEGPLGDTECKLLLGVAWGKQVELADAGMGRASCGNAGGDGRTAYWSEPTVLNIPDAEGCDAPKDRLGLCCASGVLTEIAALPACGKLNEKKLIVSWDRSLLLKCKAFIVCDALYICSAAAMSSLAALRFIVLASSGVHSRVVATLSNSLYSCLG